MKEMVINSKDLVDIDA